jgi:hypothetical protein
MRTTTPYPCASRTPVRGLLVALCGIAACSLGPGVIEPPSVHAQQPAQTPVPDTGDRILVNLIVIEDRAVEEEILSSGAGLIRTYVDPPLPSRMLERAVFPPVVFLRAAELSPRSIQEAFQAYHSARQAGLLGEGADREIAFAARERAPDRVAHWAVHAYEMLSSQEPSVIPWLPRESLYRSLGLGVAPGLIPPQ